MSELQSDLTLKMQTLERSEGKTANQAHVKQIKSAWKDRKGCPCLRSTQHPSPGKILGRCFSYRFPQSCWYLPTEAQLSSGVLIDAVLDSTAMRNDFLK